MQTLPIWLILALVYATRHSPMGSAAVLPFLAITDVSHLNLPARLGNAHIGNVFRDGDLNDSACRLLLDHRNRQPFRF